ncbi:hypothetical protein [Bradyrhizobium sp. CCBAU 53338]|uniref:hypothetical protein n=1 Tax=Bradyrhizobium sp. CCBAU 53338 TaxID=1325111 RepID=UPI001FEE4D19|nr:hypothetical protein [Bradyrhizobium sp. CCBAU 53338]
MTFDAIFALLVGYFSPLGAAMQSRFKGFLGAAIFLSLAIGTSAASAADLGLVTSGPVGSCSDLVFVCENGRQYPLCPIAVSVAGEVVTATLHTGGHGGAHVRMVPMGVGYRYAGRGVWLDGFRENALLNFGKHTQIACTLAH